MSGSKTVITPFGERPRGNVHAVSAGGRVVLVQDEVQIIDATGSARRVAKYDNNTEEIVPKDDWVTYAYWQDKTHPPTSIASFTAAFRVPDEPDTRNGQTLFLSNSLESTRAKPVVSLPPPISNILEPVLQYGPSAAGGGDYWAVASWALIGNEVFYTCLVRVYPGVPLVGTITLRGTTETTFGRLTYTKYHYTSSFSTIPGTTLDLPSPTLDVAIYRPLEFARVSLGSYHVKRATDYPDDSTLFYPVTVRTTPTSDLSGTAVVDWIPVVVPPNPPNLAFKVATKVNRNGATDAKITILYPNDLNP